MALKACSQCGEQVSETAATCPKCGESNPGVGTGVKGFLNLVAVGVGIAVMVMCYQFCSSMDELDSFYP